MSTDEEQRQQSALREYARSLSDEEWNLFSAQVRPPSDPASARRSIAGKAQQLWDVPKDRNGAVGSMAAAVAARQPEPRPQPNADPQQFQPPPNTGYTGSDSLRRTPFVTPATTTTTHIR